jgi:hypothetical protein
LWMRYWTFGFHKMRGISWLAEEMSASQEGVCFMKIFGAMYSAFGRALLLTYVLAPWSRVLLEKPTGFAASQEIPRIYRTRKLITVLTSARHWQALLWQSI